LRETGGTYYDGWYIDDVKIIGLGFQVNSVTPRPGSENMPTNTNLAVAFSKPINQSTVSNASWFVRGTGSGQNHGTIVPTDTGATYQPSPLFEPGEAVRCSLSTAIMSTEGETLPAPVVWEFTVASSDTVCPKVVSIVPVRDDREVPRSSTLRSVFSEPVQPSTISSGTWTVSGSQSGAVAGTLSVTTDGRTVTFSPSSPFQFGETITSRLSAQVSDLAGNLLDGNEDGLCGDAYEWAFAVELGDTTFPRVAGVSPRAGSHDVAAGTSLGVRFSKPIEALTVNDATWTVAGSMSHAVTGQIEWVSPDSVTFRPEAPFLDDEEVTATLSGAIADTSGHYLDGNGDGQGGDSYTWSFRVVGDRPIAVPARDDIPAGRYLMMSLPVRLEQGTHLSTALSDLGPPGAYKWRGFGFANGAYVEDPVVAPGQSIILCASESPRPTFRGLRHSDSIAVTLQAGWNLIGCIDDSAGSYPWSRCLVISGGIERPFSDQGDVQRAVLWWEDETGDLRNNGLWQTLSDSSSLFSEPPARSNPWGGYLLEASMPCTLVFRERVAVPLASKGGANDGSPFSGVTTDDRATRAAATGDWSIRLYAEADDTRDGWLELGVSSDATAGRDGHDIRKPPSLGDGVRLSIGHGDWPDKSAGEYLTDIRGPGETAYGWDLTVGFVGDRRNEDTASLAWQDVGGVPAEWNVYLVTGEARAVDMRTANRYDLVLRAGESRGLTVRVSRDPWPGQLVETGLSRILELGPSPAPNDVNMRLQIGRAGVVDVSVFDVQGRILDRLMHETREPGPCALTWSPKRNGVASGVYFVKLRTAAGTDTRRVCVIRG
jgi:hypothetical protein